MGTIHIKSYSAASDTWISLCGKIGKVSVVAYVKTSDDLKAIKRIFGDKPAGQICATCISQLNKESQEIIKATGSYKPVSDEYYRLTDQDMRYLGSAKIFKEQSESDR